MKKTIKFIKYFVASSLVFVTSWILGQRNSSDYSFTSIVHAEIPIYHGGGGGWSGDSSGDGGSSDSGGTSVDGSCGSSDGGSCGSSSA